jgi:hypothetical protein
MSGVVSQTAEQLVSVLRTVEGLRVTSDPAAVATGPTAVVGPPALTWESYCVEPTGAVWVVHLVVDATERTVENLWRLVTEVAAAVDERFLAGSVIRADPGTWSAGGTDLPSYAIQVDVVLGE